MRILPKSAVKTADHFTPPGLRRRNEAPGRDCTGASLLD
jgi:hypothetical protein